MFFILITIALVNLLAIINLYLQIGKLLNEVADTIDKSNK